MLGLRPNGISTLLACQNEEVTVGWSILSFLDFSDEVIVVDNGSTDATKDICREMQRQHPEKVKFYDVPQLKDLYENRQYAFERSRFRWIVRGDADFVCYTDGEYDCRNLRAHVLNRPSLTRPEIYCVPLVNLHGDFWHSGASLPDDTVEWQGRPNGNRRFPIMSHPTPRIFRSFPGFRFARLGRWEGVPLNRVTRRLVRNVYWPHPIWMQCNIKSDKNYFRRSERTNWRELGDYKLFPTLESFLSSIVEEKYGTTELAEAQRIYVENHILPLLAPYDAEEWYPYPRLVLEAMQSRPVYRIENDCGRLIRDRVNDKERQPPLRLKVASV